MHKICHMLLIILAAVSLLALIIYNVRCNDQFFVMSLHNILMLIISIGVAYYLAQRRIDTRRHQDGHIKVIEKLIGDIQKSLSDDFLYTDWDDNLIKSRAINNKINVLEQVCQNYDNQLQQDVIYIKENFHSLRALYEEIYTAYTNKNIDIPPYKVRAVKNLVLKILSKTDSLWVDTYTKA